MLRHTTQPMPGYTRPYLWPEQLMDQTFFNWKSHTRSGSTNGANMPPDAPSTWMRMGSFGCSWL